MINDKKIAVVVPAYNEEKLIGRVIETMPEYVDHIVIVDDGSRDRTAEIVRSYQTGAVPERIVLIKHETNKGVGGAIATGYKWSKNHDIDIAVVMDGDAQMSPNDLPMLLTPLVSNQTDFTKGNRLVTGEAWRLIPKVRYLGNAVLSFLTKIASGYWHIADSQTGYTAMNRRALHIVDWDCLYKRYGYPNDRLVRLNVYDLRVMDVPIQPIYNIGEKSGIKIGRLIFLLSWLLLTQFLWRLKEKYIIRDFHPLIFFYFLGFICFAMDAVQIVRMFVYMAINAHVPEVTALSVAFLTITGLQSVFFAMWMDMEYNRHLNRHWPANETQFPFSGSPEQ